MRRPFHFIVSLIVFAALLSGASGATAQDTGPQPILIPEGGSPLTTAFTYQGVLKEGSTPFTGTCQKLDFYLFDVANPPNGYPQIGLIQLTGVPVSNGLLNINLDFGASVFNGERRWLQIQHDCNNTGGTFVMTPTQELKASPYAFFATKAPWAGLLSVPAGFADNIDNDTQYSAGTGLTTDLTGLIFSVVFSGTGSANTVARSDHNHTGVYAPLSHSHAGSDITSAVPTATVALSATAAPWGGLTGVPSGFADDVDNDTQYTAGDGLMLGGISNTVFSVVTDGITANMVGFNYAGSVSEGGPASDLNCAIAPCVSASEVDTVALNALYVEEGQANSITSGMITDGQVTSADLADGTVVSADIADGTVASADIADGTITNTDVNSALVQLRVKGPCAVGSSIRDIAVDGSVTCEEVSPRPVFATTRIDDTANDDGSHTSIIIGVDGLGLISYYDASSTALKVAHCETVTCTTATITTLDNSGSVGQYSSITIGKDGRGLISYYESTSPTTGRLKVAHCNNAACTSATITPLPDPSSTNYGQYTSITIGADGRGLISYYDVTNANLKVAHCSDDPCSNLTSDPSSIDGTGTDVGQYTSVTIGVDGLGLISYYDVSDGDLKVAHCLDASCSSASTTPITLDDPVAADSTDTGKFTSVTIGTDGFALISYYDATVTNGALKVVHCTNVPCTLFDTPFTLHNDVPGLPGNENVGQYTSVTIGEDGFGLITYYDVTNSDLKVAHCSNVACNIAPPAEALVVVLDNDTVVGQYTSVTIGVDGMPLISYYDAGTELDLKVAHCSNTLCIPYFRRR